MERNPSLKLFLILILLGCMVPPAAAGSGDESPWVYEPTNGIYGMYDGINDAFWVYDPIDDIYWKLDVYNGDISGLTGYSISYSPDYDPSAYYDLFWVQGANEYEICAYDSGSEQIFLYDSFNAAYWVYEPDPDIVWDYASEGEIFDSAGVSGSDQAEDWVGSWAIEEEPGDWAIEEEIDSSFSSESETFITNEELVNRLVWHRAEIEGYFWTYAPVRDFFLMYSPYNGLLAVYGPRDDLWRSYGEIEARNTAWQREEKLGIVWVYDPTEDLFWIYYPEDEFVQGYSFSRELFWDFPVERLNFVGETSDKTQVSSAGQVEWQNPDDSSGEGGGFLFLLLIVGGLFLLKRRRSKRREKALASSTYSDYQGPSGSSGPLSESDFGMKTAGNSKEKKIKGFKGKESDNKDVKEENKGFGLKNLKKEKSSVEKGASISEKEATANSAFNVDASAPEMTPEMAPEMNGRIESEKITGYGTQTDAVPPVKDAAAPDGAFMSGSTNGPSPASSSGSSSSSPSRPVSSGIAWQEKGAAEESTSDWNRSKEDLVEGFPAALMSKYEPLGLLGKGGFAAVFKAKRKTDLEIVALKIPRIDEKTSAYFIKEVAAWYNLNHPNIVRLYKSDLLPVPYLEMEYVDGVEKDGTSIRELEKYPKPLPEAGTLKLIRGIAEGLSHAHSRGIYHHDLKPLNVLLGNGMEPKITDFGLAKIGARNSLTTHNAYSPLYAAPEQLDESLYGKPDQRTDIYQLGMMFYELLCGKLPYSGCSMGAVLGKILSREVKPEAISRIDPSLAHYEGIVEKMLAQEKENRYQEVREFLAALDALEKLDLEEEEMKKSLEKTKQTLKISTSREEIEKITREVVGKTAKIALLYAGVNEKPGLLGALEDLRGYAREDLPELDSAISQLEYMAKNGIPVGTEFEESLKVLLDRIENGTRNK